MKKSKLSLICAMAIFGTIGIIRRHIDLPSSFIALARAVIGTVFLLAVTALRRERPNWSAIRKSWLPLVLSGGFLGFNWVFLFESYRCTSVATATLCYYMAPVLVILASPLLKEKLTVRKALCVPVAIFGMVLVSGVWDTGIGSLSELKGILFGLAAAVFYAGVMLLNKKIAVPSAYDKTIVQLFMAAAVLAPYVLLTEDMGALNFSPVTLALLPVAGVVHTGIAYALYFGSMKNLPAQTVALYSYIDPILAIVLSAMLLGEPMTPASAIGALLILGAAFFSEKQ